MNTGTRVWLGAVVLFGLVFAYLAQEYRQPPGDPGSEPAREFESPSEVVAAARADEPLPPPVGLRILAHWQVSTCRAPITGDVTVQLVTSSRNPIEHPDGTFRPTLVLRCGESGLEASVVTGVPARRLPGFHDEHAVTLRFGEDPARDVRVRSRFEKRVLLLEPAADVIREMLRNDRLVLSFTPLSPARRPTEMRFDLSGLRDAVPELGGTCAV
jgi:hypothetical protein